MYVSFRSGKRRTHPSFNSHDQERISNWNKNMAETTQAENKELKVCLRRTVVSFPKALVTLSNAFAFPTVSFDSCLM